MRRMLALLLSLWLTPGINELFRAGVNRGVGEAGARMAELHRWASTLGKVAVVCAAAWIGIGITIKRRRGTRLAATEPGTE